MTLTVADLRTHLVAEAKERLFCTGGQLYVSLSGQTIIDLEVGVDAIGIPVAHDTLFAMYCAGKPVVAIAIACLVEDGELSLDDQLGDVLDGEIPPRLCQLLVGELLNHTAGLHRLNAYHYLVVSEQRRDGLVWSCMPPPGWHIGTQVAYSEVAAWHILALIIAELGGEPARQYIKRRVLDVIGSRGTLFVVGMDPEEFVACRDRLGVNVWLQNDSGDPLLVERTSRFRCTASASLATSGTGRGLGHFYEALLDIHRDRDGGPIKSDTLRVLTSVQSEGHDPIMDRYCSYGYGFMTQLGEHHFGSRVSSSAFGHSGNGGMTAGFCDPDNELVVAFHFNGRVDAESAIMFRRPALVDRIYDAVLD